jgi:hypothetical protein
MQFSYTTELDLGRASAFSVVGNAQPGKVARVRREREPERQRVGAWERDDAVEGAGVF